MMNPKDHSLPAVVAVVLNYNGMKFLPQCLDDLHSQDYANIRVILSDNGSTDESLTWVRAHYPDVCIIENNSNLGWAAGNNAGIRQALAWKADWVWVINYDVAIDDSCVSRLVEYGKAKPNVGLLAPLIHYFEPRHEVWFSGGKVDPSIFYTWHCRSLNEFQALPQANRFITGCAMMVRRQVFERIGLIDERFFMYLEDVDFSLRATAAGYSLAVVEDAGFYHKAHFGGSGSGQDMGSPFMRYHQFRSKLLFWRKHAGWWRFHTKFCPRHLSKYLYPAVKVACDDEKQPSGQAYINALWSFIRHRRSSLIVHECPAWFTRFVVRRTWVIVWLLSFGRTR